MNRSTRSSSALQSIESVGDDVEVLAKYDGAPVMVRQGNILASSFHPEMTDDERVHELFVSMAKGN